MMPKKEKKPAEELELLNVDKELDIILTLIRPKDTTYVITQHLTNDKPFWVLTITEPVTESLFTTGQDQTL